MLSNILKNRRLRMGSFATALTVVFIAVLIILNMIVSAISERFPVQLDLTTGKIYELSDETIEYLRTVEKDVNIYVLATEDSSAAPTNIICRPARRSKNSLSIIPELKCSLSTWQRIRHLSRNTLPIPWAPEISCWSVGTRFRLSKPAICLIWKMIPALDILILDLPEPMRPLPQPL